MDSDRDVRGPIIVPRGDRMIGMDRDRGRSKSNGRRRGQPGDKPRQHGNPRNDYMTNNSMQGPMRILTKPVDRQPLAIPGSVSIMQREPSTSGSDAPISPHTLQSPDTLPIPHSHGLNTHHTSSSSHPSLDGGKRLARRPDGMSSSPSSYTPLHPGRSGRGDRERDGMFSRTDSGFVGPVNSETFTMKLIDKSLHWEDKITEHLIEQSDFLVVGCLGRQGVGKSTVMSLLAGTRTGSGRPYLFRTQSKDTQDTGGFQTSGVDMVVTSERIILLDTQPILSEVMLDQHISEGLVPSGMSPESYLDVLSLQLAIFLFATCHVVVVVMESGDLDVILRFLWIAEKLKPTACKMANDVPPDLGDGKPPEYFPQIVFVLNHATPDDFQPSTLKELHSYLAENFVGTRISITGGISLARSGLVPVGKFIPDGHKGVPGTAAKGRGEVDEIDINLHLLPTNSNPQDNFGAHCVERHDREDAGLNPVLSLIPMYYKGHPSFHLLAETFRNQIFTMPRPSPRPSRASTTTAAAPAMFEREWHDYARRVWTVIKKSDLSTEHKRLLRDMKT